MEKLVSIVLPVHNGEKYLDSSIESVLKQTYRNIELIIVDDCSTDSSRRIMDKYSARDNRVHIVANEVNLKLPGALNAGFVMASGYYLTWTSDDNLYAENAIEVMVSEIQKSLSDMVYADYIEIDEEGNVLAKVQERGPEKLFKRNVVGACFLYTAKIAKYVGKYDRMLFLAEDYDYWLRIFEIGKIVHIKEQLYYYRRHQGSLTESKKKLVMKQANKTVRKNFTKLFQKTKTMEERNDLFDNLLMYRDSKAFKRTLWKLVKLRPVYLLHFCLREVGKAMLKRRGRARIVNF